MANNSLSLTSLDFDTLKQSFKDYLSTQSVFKDYNFDGSNINTLLDVMSYNSYLNSFYLNMIHSEMFLDSAQKYDSVVSHAKELNYMPRSYSSSAAEVSFTLETSGLDGSVYIPKGTKFTGLNSNGSFVFTTKELASYTSSNNTFVVNDLSIYEGIYFQDTYTINYQDETQQFLMTNAQVDTDSLTVVLSENNGAQVKTLRRALDLFGLDSTSDVYFLQAAQDGLYEVIFGDGLFGRKPLNGSLLTLSYRVANGADADGVTMFSLDDDLTSYNEGGNISASAVVTSTPSAGGAANESIDSIKFSAPRYFATQQRAVASDDFSSLIISNFSGEVADVNVYGGETVYPKQYGKVIVSIKPSYGEVATNITKNKISNFMVNYSSLPTRIVITDPDYLYCSVESIIQYDTTKSNKSSSEIESIALDTIINYSKNNLEKFSRNLRYSRLVNAIDVSEGSITSNDTDIRIVKRISPLQNFPTSYDIDVGNVIYYEGKTTNTAIAHTELFFGSYDTHVQHASLSSSLFTYVSDTGTQYPLSYMADDGDGKVKVYTSLNDETIALKTVGAIDYAAGQFTINRLAVNSYGNYISISLKPRLADIFAQSNKIIIIDPNDVNIVAQDIRESI